MFKTVLVGADGSETATRAVETALGLVKAFGSALHVVTAYPVGTPAALAVPAVPAALAVLDLPAEASENPADEVLEEMRSVMEAADVEAEYHAVGGEPAEAILRIADRFGADLIVVGNRGMKGIRRVLGSVPNSVAHGANCSVLVVDAVSGH